MPKTIGSEGISIVVKFKDNVSLPYKDGLEKELAAQKIAAWEAFVEKFPDCTFRRMCRTFRPENTKELFAQARKISKWDPARLLKYFVIDCPLKVPVKDVLKMVRTWKEVQSAYLPPLVAHPPVGNQDAIESKNQHYLRAAPIGIDADYAWLHAGGRGTGQEVIDIERGWLLNHQDLLDSSGAQRVQLLGTRNDPALNFASHGTAVLGVLVATRNQNGILGVAHDVATAGVVGHDARTESIPAAIEMALLSFAGVPPGNLTTAGNVEELANAGQLPQVPNGPVLLLEMQLREPVLGEDGMPVRGSDGKPLFGSSLPAEIDPAIFDMIEFATALGVVVIEAAGNGPANLDDHRDRYRDGRGRRVLYRANDNPDFLDSGAIMVGSGNRPDELAGFPSPWERQGDSNYGSRIDCFAWGNSVFTARPVQSNLRANYDNLFSGTSGAAAIVAGAALSLQGMAQHAPNHATRFTPAEAREILSERPTQQGMGNTPTANPNMDRIGVMPNLKHIAQNKLGLPQPV